MKTATIMSYIGGGANRLSEIAGRCGEVATNLSRPLAKLISLGYLTKEIPFGENEKNSKKSLYKTSDPFMNFYFQFIIPNRSFIEIGRISPILSNLDNHFSNYVGNYWEKLCRETVSGNEIEGITYGMARSWWGSDRLLAELKEKAGKLPFAKDYIIIPKLFLKNPPIGSQENVLLPNDVIKLNQ